MKYDTDKHGIFGKIGIRGNQFRTKYEPKLDSYFNELINFTDPFATIFVREKNEFSSRYQNINSYELPPGYPKRKIYRNFVWDCVWITEMKSKSKKSIVKLEFILIRTAD